MKKTIGILGGMGPLATADLYRKIIERTRADRDSEHIRVYIDGNAAIPDRTAAILHGGEDPVPEMLSALRHLEACGADCIIGIDRLFDMGRTALNVVGDASCAVCVNTWEAQMDAAKAKAKKA